MLTRREFIRRGGCFAIGAAVGPHLLAACGAAADTDTLRRIRDAGVATLGIANEEPYGYFDADQRLTGAGPAVATAVLARLGVPRVEGEVADFGGLIPDVEGQRFDLIAAGMFITTERCEEVIFSDPDFCTLQAFAVPVGNPNGFTDHPSVADTDVQIGVLGGSIESRYFKVLDVPDERVRKYRRADGLLGALRDGEVEVVALNSIALRAAMARFGDGLEMTDPFQTEVQGPQTVFCSAYGFREDDVAFRDEFNAVLVEMKANDDILPLVEQFGITGAEVDAAKDRTAEDLCIGARRD